MLDPSFGFEGTGATRLPPGLLDAGVYDIAQDSSGRLALAGLITPRREGSAPAIGMTVAVLRSDGALDKSFGELGFAAGRATGATGVAIQPDDKIVVVGYENWGHSADINHKYSAALARLNPDGSFDRSFNGGHFESLGMSVARDVAVQANGRIVVVGVAAPYFQSTGVVLRFKPDGRVDRSFGKRGRIQVFAPRSDFRSADLLDVVVQPDGKLLVAGGIEGRILVQRMLTDGTPDPGFGGGDGRVAVKFDDERCECQATAHAIRLQSDGRIVVVADEARGPSTTIVTRLLADGRLDRSFGPSRRGFFRIPDSYALGLAIQRDDKIVVAARRGARKVARFAVVRLRPNGLPDRAFGDGGMWARRIGDRSEATSALVQPNGRIVVAGHSFEAAPDGGIRSFVVKRLFP